MTTIYIDPETTDPIQNGTEDHPYATPAAAGTLVAGNSYLLRGGSTFVGKWNLSGSGTSSNPIVISSYGIGNATINAAGETQGIVGNGVAYYRVSNINIIGSPSNAGIVFWSRTTTLANDVRITNCHVTGSGGAGIAVTFVPGDDDFPGRATDVSINSCTTDNTNGHGVAVSGPYDGATIQSCEVNDFGKTSNTWGVYMGGDSVAYAATADAWVESPNNVWTATLKRGSGASRTNVTVDSVIYSSVALEETHWLIRDATLSADYRYDWNATEVVMRLPEGVQPNTGCGCSTVVNYAGTLINGVIQDCIATEARNSQDGVGIGFDRGAENGTLRRCQVDGTNGPGISVHLCAGGSIDSNTLNNCGETLNGPSVEAIGCKSGETISVYGNTVVTDYIGIRGGGETSSTVDLINNIIYGGTTGVDTATTGYGVVSASYNTNTATTPLDSNITDNGNNITTDPLFRDVSAGDFELTFGSTSINSGFTLSDAFILDLESEDRRRYGAWDRGALVYDRRKAMATAQNVIDSARYDLEDYQEGIIWDSTELLNYLNRMVIVMNSELASLNSELVEGEETDIDCVEDQKYVDLSNLNSGLWSNIKMVWIGQDLIEQISLASMRYKRIFRSDQSSRPFYWAVRNEELLFEQDCDDSYDTLILYYNKKQAALALTDAMPYQGRFNEAFREMLVLHAQARKDGNPSQVNGMMNVLFKKRAMEEVIGREFVQKPYHIDF